MVLGYSKSIELMIMVKSGDLTGDEKYAIQSKLSLITYPLLLKFLYAPIIDTYYFRSIGRSKTYIFILGLLAGISVLIFAPRADLAVENKEIALLAGFWFFVNFLANFQQVAFESWTVTIVDQAYRKYMAIMLILGFSTGDFTSYNAFVFLNSQKSINDNFGWFCQGQDSGSQRACLENLRVTHTRFVRFMGVLVLLVSFYVLLFIKERVVDQEQEEANRQNEIQVIDHDQPDRGLKGILFQFIPKLMKNKAMRVFIFYLIASRFFFELYKRSLDLRFVGKGMELKTINLVNTLVFPFALLTGYLSSPFIKRGSAMRRYQLIVTIEILACTHRFYLTYIYSKGYEHKNSFFTQILINNIIGQVKRCNFYFWFGHLNMIITDLAYSSTILAIFTSVNNAAGWGVNYIGLKTIQYMEGCFPGRGYNWCVTVATICALVSMYLLRGYTVYLDELPTEE